MSDLGPRLAAWAVHAYTTSGVVLALLMVHFAEQGEVQKVLYLFLVAMIVDGTDGMIARRLEVKRWVPLIDGSLLDNIVDYITYAFAPMVLLWGNGFLPDGWFGGVVAAVPLVASCFQFTRTDAKTEDHFFLGFPSYWNVIAFYVVVFDLDPAVTAVILLVLSVLVFVPIKYIYPSRTEHLWYSNMALASLWLVLFGVITYQYPGVSDLLTVLSLLYLGYYVALSLWLTLRTRRRADAVVAAAEAQGAP